MESCYPDAPDKFREQVDFGPMWKTESVRRDALSSGTMISRDLVHLMRVRATLAWEQMPPGLLSTKKFHRKTAGFSSIDALPRHDCLVKLQNEEKHP